MYYSQLNVSAETQKEISMLIYMATNQENGKEYIGQTVRSLKQRKRCHISDSLNSSNTHFHRSIKKYGQENFDWEILHDDITNIDDLNNLETYYIGYYDTFKNGYNLTEGGGGCVGYSHTEESLRKISIAMKGSGCGENNSMYGVHRFGKSAPNYGKRYKNRNRKREKASEETKLKMSEVRVGRFTGKENPNARAVIIDNGYFDTINEAAKFVEITTSSLRNRIKHKTKWLGYKYVKR